MLLNLLCKKVNIRIISPKYLQETKILRTFTQSFMNDVKKECLKKD